MHRLKLTAMDRVKRIQQELDAAIDALIPLIAKSSESRIGSRVASDSVSEFETLHPNLVEESYRKIGSGDTPSEGVAHRGYQLSCDGLLVASGSHCRCNALVMTVDEPEHTEQRQGRKRAEDERAKATGAVVVNEKHRRRVQVRRVELPRDRRK